jgi:hypothetical protein
MKLLLMGLFAIVTVNAQIHYRDIVLADSPAAYWRMDEPAGSPYVTDDSGHGQPAIVQGTVFFDQIGALHDSPNTSVELAGAGYFLTPLYQIAVSEYSLEAWVNTFATIAPILQDRGYNDVNKTASVSVTLSVGQPELADGAVHCSADGDNISVGGRTQLLVNDGRWHHVVCVFSGVAGQTVTPSQFKIYVDGISQPLTVINNGARPVAPLTGSNGTTIGIHPIWQQGFGMPNYAGLLDEVAVYRYALSAGQVRAHYAAGECPLICE